ncbi:MAG TPA: hypothetical protein DEF00_03715 [Candidatus Taylorbacteria bacterium]|nr:hypothetical protein [Candidatus Taylorbacteria bacterium]
MRASSYAGLVIKPVLQPFDVLIRLFSPKSFSWFDIVAPPLLRAFARLHIGKLETEVREKDSDRTRCFWLEAKRRGINMVMFRLGPIKDLFIAKHGGKTICFDGLPRPAGPEARSLYWMDNKPLMRKRFIEAGIPVAKGVSAFSERGAIEGFRALKKPVIVKPYSGSRSRHTAIHLESEQEFLKAFQSAKMLSPFALIEEELVGMVHRGTLIGSKLIGVIRREPPHVIGDGKHTVRELVMIENRNEKRHGGTFHEIVMGGEAEAELLRQKLAWKSIPREGQLVTLNQKVSRGIGASNTDVTGKMHPENRKLLEKIGAVLNDPLVGVDFIMEDVGVPWQKQKRAGVIECNSMPFIDLHHYPLCGMPRNVAGALWDIIFPGSGRKPEHQVNTRK